MTDALRPFEDDEIEPPVFYAEQHIVAGFEVFPCNPATKAPLTINGHRSASSDPTLVRMWWDAHPAALIGVKVPDDFVVLDIDPRNGGSLEALTAAVGLLPDTYTVWSGRGDGGHHRYYRLPAWVTEQHIHLRGKVPNAVGVDVKAQGRGYVIGYGSLHPATGLPYRVNDLPVATLPDGLVKALLPPTAPSVGGAWGQGREFSIARAQGLYEFVLNLKEGDRNSGLFWALCRMFEMDPPDAAVNIICQAGVDIGLDVPEVDRILRNAMNRFVADRLPAGGTK